MKATILSLAILLFVAAVIIMDFKVLSFTDNLPSYLLMCISTLCFVGSYLTNNQTDHKAEN